MYTKKTKRNKIDKCNICLKTTELTWDHVPPQGCLNFNKVEITSFFNKLAGHGIYEKTMVSQNGLKYRTICKTCNSLLGAKYDEELNNLVKTLTLFVNSDLLIPQRTSLNVKPLPIIKSVIGHILAAKKELDAAKFDTTYREFVLDEKSPIPDNLNLFYWIYPYENTIIMRDFVMPIKRDGDLKNTAFFQLLKFFPLAFLLTEVENYQGLSSLTTNKSITMESKIDIPFNFNIQHDQFWPATVGKNDILVMSKETLNSVFITNKKTKHQ